MKELNDMLNTALENLMLEFNTCMPGEIVSYDKSKQLAKVKPSFKRKYKDGSEVVLPEVFNVPVCFPRSGSFAIHFPLVKGDKVLLVFSQRSLDKWISTGATVIPDDPRKFHLSDAIAVPGLYPKNKPIKLLGSSDALVAQSENGYLEIKKDGEITLKNKKAEINASSDGKFKLTNGSTELLEEISTLIDNLISAKVITGMGDQPFYPDSIADFTERKSKIDEIKG